MSQRENLSALLATRGKGGSIESISQASDCFSSDSTLAPSDFITADKLDASKALTLVGGYIASKYGIAPKVVITMRNTIGNRYSDLLSLFELDKVGFLAGFAEVETEYLTASADKVTLEKYLGTDAERAIKSAQTSVDKITRIVSPKVRFDLMRLVASIQYKLDYKVVDVPSTPEAEAPKAPEAEVPKATPATAKVA
jgi:hypothetical protein